MIPTKSFSAGLGALLAVTVSARADLIIEQETVANGQTQVLVMKIKGDRMKTEIGKDTTSIVDLRTMDSVTLMHPQKMAMKTPGSQVKAMQEAARKDGEFPKPMKTGKKEKAGGFDCEVWTLEVAGTKMTMYVAGDYPGYEGFKEEMLALTRTSGSGAGYDLGGMVVKTEVDTGAFKLTSHVKSVKKTPLDDSEFKVPADYKELGTSGQ